MAETRVRLVFRMLAAAGVLLVGLVGWLEAQPSAAQPDTAQPSAGQDSTYSPVLLLRQQSIWLDEVDELEVTFRLQGMSDVSSQALMSSLELVLGVPVRSRTAFQDRVTNPANAPVWQRIRGLALPAPNADGAFTLRAQTTASLPTDTQSSNEPVLILPEEGVYPLSLILRSVDGTQAASLHTFVVRLPRAQNTNTPLLVSTVLSVDGQPGVNPQGELELTQGFQRLQALADVLSSHGANTNPVTITLQPHLIDALALSSEPQHATLLAQLLQSVANRQVAANTYVPIDSDAWIGEGLSLEIGWQMEAGARVLTTELDTAPDHTTMVLTNSASAEYLQRLQRERVELVLVPDTLLELSEQPTSTSAQTSFLLAAGNSPMRALAIDSTVTASLVANPNPDVSNLEATVRQMPNPYLALAALAARWFEDPQQVRAIVLAPPLTSRLTASSTRTLLDEIVASPILTPVSPQSIAEQIPATTLRQVVPVGESGFGEDYNAALKGGQQIARSYQNMVDPITTVGTPERELIDALERALLLSGTDGLTETERDAYLAVVAQTVRNTVAAIEPPSRQRITLTSRTENIPMLIRNHLDHDVVITLALNSDKLEFPQGDSLLWRLSPGINRLEAPVRAKTSGDAILEVSVQSPEGLLTLGETQLTVRATSLSGAGVAIAAASSAILALWWARHWRARRASSVSPR